MRTDALADVVRMFSFQWILSFNCLCQEWGQVQTITNVGAISLLRVNRALAAVWAVNGTATATNATANALFVHFA